MANKAFRLRKATASDYSFFKQSMLDPTYDWLMLDTEILNLTDNEFDDDSDAHFFNTLGTTLINQFDIEMYHNYLKWYRIFIIESPNLKSPIGYVKLELYSSKQILRSWRMPPSHQDDALLSEILAECEKKRYPKCKELQVIAMSQRATTFLESHGYHAKVHPFFKKSVS